MPPLNLGPTTGQTTLVLLVASLVFLATSCGGKTNFAGSDIQMVSDLSASVKDSIPKKVQDYTFGFEVAGGEKAVSGNNVPARTQITHSDTGGDIAAEDLRLWSVTLSIGDTTLQQGAVGTHVLDLSKYSGYVRIKALFVNSGEGQREAVVQDVFVDNEAPLVTLSASSGQDGRISLNWFAFDNYGLDSRRTKLMACLPGGAVLNDPLALSNLVDIPKECAVVADGAIITGLVNSLEVSQVSIAGVDYLANNLEYGLVAADLFGKRAATKAGDASKIRPTLALASEIGDGYSNQSEVSIPVRLILSEDGKTTSVHEQRALWSQYTLTVDCGDGKKTIPFERIYTRPAPSEGPLTCDFLAERTLTDAMPSVSSNHTKVGLIIDRTPPVVSQPVIRVPSGFLSKDAKVNLRWSVSDSSGLQGTQKVEYRPKPTANNPNPPWQLLVEVPSGDRSVELIWGEGRPVLDFEARVVVKDRAENTGTGPAKSWSRPFFNMAVLTSSVRCLFCHIKIEGDMAGINFPAELHAGSGEKFSVTGTLYATGAIPAPLKPASTSLQENYRDTGDSLRVFPTTVDAAGVPQFPVLDSGSLKAKMEGSIINGPDGKRIERHVTVPWLSISGTAEKPFILNGEVFIDGDIFIRGVYKGQGTIYARSIIVVDDIVSIDCTPLTNPACPFPFKGNTDEEKFADAQKQILLKKSSLQLGALDTLWVGAYENRFNGVDGVSYTPQQATLDQWNTIVNRATHLQLGSIPVVAQRSRAHYYPLEDNPRGKIEVNRIDAYLYGNKQIVFRSYANFLINGGFMGYKAAMNSSYPYFNVHGDQWRKIVGDQFIPLNTSEKDGLINPRNGLQAQQNIIRYDYRLRAGGPGFEALKEFFASPAP